MDLQQLMLILRARRLIFWSVLGGIFSIALIASLLWPKTYVGEVQVIVDAKGIDPITGSAAPTELLPSYTLTQVDIITSHSVALKVVDQLKLADQSNEREQFIEATDGTGAIRDWLADKLSKKLDVTPAHDSNVISIDFRAREPQFAATVANAFAEAYIQTALELKMDPSRRQASWFDQQLKELRATLEKAQRRLSDFQREKGIAGADDRLDVEDARLAELSNQLVKAQGETYDTGARMRQMNEVSSENRLLELPDIMGNTLLQSMKADLVRAQGKLATTAQRYDRNHPEYQSAAAEVDALQKKLSTEINTAKGAIVEAAQLAKKREDELRQAVEQQKTRILALKNGRDEQYMLAREVENAQHSYDTAVQRASQVRLESRLDQSNVAILNPAIPPLRPAQPRIAADLIAALALGLLLGIATVLIAELRDRRVRRSADLAKDFGIPVLAEVSIALAHPQRMQTTG